MDYQEETMKKIEDGNLEILKEIERENERVLRRLEKEQNQLQAEKAKADAKKNGQMTEKEYLRLRAAYGTSKQR